MFKPSNIKGATDNTPEIQIMRNRVTDILRRNFESYGYLPIETAQLNYLDLLNYKYNPDAEIVREIYKIKDQGDRDLGLRFDLTVPFCKYIAINRNMKMPFKRYEIGKVWRNGPVKSGRAREFYQCDVDAVGITGVHIEAELIALMVKCYRELGIDVVIKYGNRKLLTQMIRDAHAREADVESIIGIVDKMAKITTAELHAELGKYIAPTSIDTLLKNLDTKTCTYPEITELQKSLIELGINQHCEFAPYLARGLNIYTGTVWEAFDKTGTISSSLGGGGRYDNIIGNFIDNGQNYPAVGTSFGLEPIMALLMKQVEPSQCIDLILVPLGTESYCQTYADTLRTQGLKILVYLGDGDKPMHKRKSKAFEYAEANNIPYVAVIGEDEMKSGKIIAKNLKTGQTEDICKLF